MKKLAPYILIAIITAYLVYDKVQSNKKSDAFDKELIGLKTQYESKVDSLTLKITALRDSVKQEKKIVANLLKQAKTIDKQADIIRYRYNQLKKQIPKTQKDSLGNYIQREVVLLQEVKTVRKASKKKDSVIAIQFKTITKLEKIDTKRDSIFLIQKEFHLKEIELYKNELKNEKKKTLLGKIIAGLAIAAAIVL